MARPTKLNPERTQVLLDALRGGNFIEPSCRMAGIGRSTLRRWLQRGRSESEEDAPFRAFRRAYKKAMAEAEADALRTIRRAATEGIEGSWQASAWLLERRFPSRWRKRAEPHAPRPPKPLNQMTDAELEEYARRLDAIGGR